MDYGLDSSYESGVVAGVLIILGIILFIGLIAYILKVIGLWKVFKKSGEEGWKAIIPIYSDYILCKITGVSPWWVLIVVLVSGLSGAISSESDLASIVSFLSSIVSIYFAVLVYVSLARAFGKSTGFAVGLILLNPIFLLILGCGESQFLGKKPMHDFVFDNINKNKTQDTNPVNDQPTPTEAKPEEPAVAAKHCPNCGAEVENGVEFCKSCGSKVE